MSNPTAVLQASTISKRFGSQAVLNSLSLSCEVGEVFLVLGANGAGKSTLLRIMAGLTRPDSGVVRMGSGARVNLASHHSFLYGQLTVRENLSLYSKIVGAAASRKADLIAEWGLGSFLETPVRDLSKGTAARVSLARALLGSPEVLLLDEPSSNLDEKSVEVLQKTLIAQRSKGIAVVATHDIARLYGVATRVAVLQGGVWAGDSGGAATEDERSAVVQRYYEANR